MADDLEELKKKKMEQMQGEKGSSKAQEENYRKQLKQIASQILTKEARSRLGNIRAAKPDLASSIEMQLVQLHKAGQIRDKITDEQLKDLLKKLQEGKKDIDIKY
ncbi:MAG: DNA-binding protein [Candidatus Nanohaloarchaeota archaeon QJJ-9]|nr:DNA-binding protein [Candidatus Nanohaloarchaeota archaeon QJJ-9]